MLNRKRMEQIRVVFATGMNTIAVLSVLCGLYTAIIQSKPDVELLLLVAAYAFLTSCTRNFSHHPLLFLLLHGIPVPLVWIFTGKDNGERIFAMVIVLLILFYSLVKKFRREERTQPLSVFVLLGILWVMYLVSRKAIGETGGEEQVVFAYLGLGCFLTEWYLSQFLDYLEMEGRTNEEIPERKLFRQGGLMALAYSGFMVVSVILFTSESLAEKVGAQIHSLLERALLFFLALLPRGSETEATESLQESSEIGFTPEMFGTETTEPSVFLEILEKIMMVAVTILIVALAAYGIYYIVHHFLETFQAEKEEAEDQIEDLRLEEKQERMEAKKQGRNLHRVFGFRTPTEKIRRKYQKLVESTASKEEMERAGRQSVREYLRGQGKKAKKPEEQAKAAENFARLYEKARYSGKECSTGESSEAASLVRTLVNR